MSRGLVLDEGAVDALNWQVSARDEWLTSGSMGPEVGGLDQIDRNGFLYILSQQVTSESRLLVIASESGGSFFGQSSAKDRLECFQRILKVATSRFSRGGVRIPVDWRVFHSGSLISFQSNRFSTHIRSRVYVDFSPEESENAFAFACVDDEREPLSRKQYSAEVFTDAFLGFEDAIQKIPTKSGAGSIDTGQFSVALTSGFLAADVFQGIPFTTWRDSKLTQDQLAFFNASFAAPLRLRGAAGTGKTLVLCLRFLKEIYGMLDRDEEFRAAFVTHSQETADMVRAYLTHIDERGALPALHAEGAVEVTTLHGLANAFVNFDAEAVSPIALDGAEGRIMQMELMNSIADADRHFAEMEGLSEGFREALKSDAGSPARTAFLCDVIDEFATVLETYGVRDVDLISEKYLKAPMAGRVLAKSNEDRQLILQMYRQFRKDLSEMNVVSLDQFIADFIAYLNSFRWDSVRSRRGFDFVFADELHLFNRQERQVLAYLMRNASGPVRVAVAYDPRQSPRSSFFPENQAAKDSIWAEAKLGGSRFFELTNVFRYSPEILEFLKRLNRHFPADDLSEEWGLGFGASMTASGPLPVAIACDNQIAMANEAVDLARRITRRAPKQRVAVLSLDQERFSARYSSAGIFQSQFVVVGSRDDVGAIQRFQSRAVLSVPEFVAGLQFDHVILMDVNASLIGKLGSGVNGLQRFISLVYLGASRAKVRLILLSDRTEGAFPQPIRDSIDTGCVVEASSFSF
jgi:hypothetical protein